jgi:hypothetical protein
MSKVGVEGGRWEEKGKGRKVRLSVYFERKHSQCKEKFAPFVFFFVWFPVVSDKVQVLYRIIHEKVESHRKCDARNDTHLHRLFDILFVITKNIHTCQLFSSAIYKEN